MITPASTYPERRDGVKLVIVDPLWNEVATANFTDLPELLAAGDLVVVNDAATLPGSLYGVDDRRRPFELRLQAALSDVAFRAVVFGPGSWREQTEQRLAAPALAPGARLAFGALTARVIAVSELSPRLCDIEFRGTKHEVWALLYGMGHPVQYSYLAHELPLWAVQTVYAGRPWAFEMPSAGRPLSWELLFALKRRGVAWASLTHATGLSSTGDPSIDANLPLPERFEIPRATVRAITTARNAGSRVLAVGTSVVRALEGAARASGELVAGPGETDLRVGPDYRPQVTDGLLSGVHEPGESHHALLNAFAGESLLGRALALAGASQFRSHELGDSMLLLPGILADRARPGTSGIVRDRDVVQHSTAVGRSDLAAAGVGAGDAGLGAA